jgi:D-mannonate dehydratase
MSTKKSKSDDNNDKIEQEALKEIETIAELAPNERTRKEAEKLMERIEGESATSVQKQELEVVESVLDDTRRMIKRTTNEAKREIPRYAKAMSQLQEETIQTTKELGYQCIEFQRETASLVPQLQQKYLSFWMPWISPTVFTEYYSRVVDNFVDNAVSATNLMNNLATVNLENVQHLADNSKENWKVGVQNAKAFSKSLQE